MPRPARSPPARSCGSPRSLWCSSLLLSGLVGEALQRLAPEGVEVVAEPCEAAGLDAVQPPRSVLAVAHEPRLLQHAEVLRHGRPADGQPVCELTNGTRAALQPLEDLTPGGVAERIEECTVSVHL